MHIFKILFILGTLFGLQGCLSSSSNYFILSVASTPTTTYNGKHKVIGVEKVTVPGYLYKRDLAVAQSNSKITLLSNALWGEDLDTGLTQRLISFLQKKFNQPDVYAYPWGISKQPNIKLSVQITRFIAQGNRVYLDASWRLENMKTKRKAARLFSTNIATKSDAESIVSSMNMAFSQFENTVAMGIKQF